MTRFLIVVSSRPCRSLFFFNDTATTEIYTLSLHDALPLPARLPLRELLLQLPGVEEDQLGELARAPGRKDSTPVSLVDDVWDQPAMVQMGMCEEHHVEGRGVIRERNPVADCLVR